VNECRKYFLPSKFNNFFQAARDACDLMGHRKFLDQVIQDTIHHEQFKVTDEIDVTTMKDYMQVWKYQDYVLLM
jgi:hypothetical protein